MLKEYLWNNDITRKLQERRNRQYFSGILEAAKELIHNILERKDVMLALVDIKSLNNYAYQHSVNVAIISLVMGISLKMTEEELTDLCIGALTHDIGKTFIPKEIAFGDYQLSDEDRLLIDTHPRKGYDYLKDVLNGKYLPGTKNKEGWTHAFMSAASGKFEEIKRTLY